MAVIGLLAFALSIVWTLILVIAPVSSDLRNRINSILPMLILAAFAVIFAVNANSTVLDRWIYTRDLQAIAGHSLASTFGLTLSSKQEPLFLAFMWIVSKGGVSTGWLYFCVGVVCSLIYAIALTRLLKSWQAPLGWLTVLSLGFFTAYASLVARQGLSMSMLVLAVCMYLSGVRTRWWVLPLAAAALFHWSAIPVAIVILLVAVLRIQARYVVVAWGIAAALFITSLNQTLLGPLATNFPALSEYTNNALTTAYTGGTNRLDFLLFSSAVLVLGFVANRISSPAPWYPKLLMIYMVLNVYFLLFGFIQYSDRLAAYSWSFAPLVLAVPFADPKTAVGRLLTGIFVAVIVSTGFLFGPFAEMVGMTPY